MSLFAWETEEGHDTGKALYVVPQSGPGPPPIPPMNPVSSVSSIASQLEYSSVREPLSAGSGATPEQASSEDKPGCDSCFGLPQQLQNCQDQVLMQMRRQHQESREEMREIFEGALFKHKQSIEKSLEKIMQRILKSVSHVAETKERERSSLGVIPTMPPSIPSSVPTNIVPMTNPPLMLSDHEAEHRHRAEMLAEMQARTDSLQSLPSLPGDVLRTNSTGAKKPFTPVSKESDEAKGKWDLSSLKRRFSFGTTPTPGVAGLQGSVSLTEKALGATNENGGAMQAGTGRFPPPKEEVGKVKTRMSDGMIRLKNANAAHVANAENPAQRSSLTALSVMKADSGTKVLLSGKTLRNSTASVGSQRSSTKSRDTKHDLTGEDASTLAKQVAAAENKSGDSSPPQSPCLKTALANSDANNSKLHPKVGWAQEMEVTKSATVESELESETSDEETDDEEDDSDEDDSDGEDIDPASIPRRTRRFSQWEKDQQNALHIEAGGPPNRISNMTDAVSLPEDWPARIVHNAFFDYIVTWVLLANTVTIGIQVETKAANITEDSPAFFNYLDIFYLVFFMAELVLRIYVSGFYHFYTGHDWLWSIIDSLVVAVQWVEFIVWVTASGEQHATGSVSRAARVLRITRVVRVVRVIRLIRLFQKFRVLITMIYGTLKTAIWATTLLVIIMYIFAVIFTTAAATYFEDKVDLGEMWVQDGIVYHFGRSDSGGSTGAAEPPLWIFYGTLPRALFTLYKAIIGGVDWGDVILPLSDCGATYVLAFMLYITFVQLAVMNVVTGLFLQSAIEQAQQDQEHVIQMQLMEKKHFVNRLRDLFDELDTSKDGTISLQEFESHLKDERMQALLQTFEILNADAWTLFKLLDTDGGGLVDINEFVDGCIRLKGGAKSIQVAQLMYHHKWIMDKLVEMSESIPKMFHPIKTNQEFILYNLNAIRADDGTAGRNSQHSTGAVRMSGLKSLGKPDKHGSQLHTGHDRLHLHMPPGMHASPRSSKLSNIGNKKKESVDSRYSKKSRKSQESLESPQIEPLPVPDVPHNGDGDQTDDNSPETHTPETHPLGEKEGLTPDGGRHLVDVPNIPRDSAVSSDTDKDDDALA